MRNELVILFLEVVFAWQLLFSTLSVFWEMFLWVFFCFIVNLIKVYCASCLAKFLEFSWSWLKKLNMYALQQFCSSLLCFYFITINEWIYWLFGNTFRQRFVSYRNQSIEYEDCTLVLLVLFINVG